MDKDNEKVTASQAIEDIDKVLTRYRVTLGHIDFDAVLSYIKVKYMKGL